MKNLKFIVIVIFAFLLVSCKEKVTKIEIEQSTIPEGLFVDEFELSSIQLKVTFGDDEVESSDFVNLTEGMLTSEGLNDLKSPGTHNIEVTYKKLTTSFTITLKERTDFSITFDTLGGSQIDSIVVKEGMNISLPNSPTKTDCTFDGWYFDSLFTAPFYDSYEVKKDITLYANWYKNSFVVTFKDEYDNVLEEQVVARGGEATFVDYTPKKGKLFLRWDIAFDNVTEDLIVKPVLLDIVNFIYVEKVEVDENSTGVLQVKICGVVQLAGYSLELIYDSDYLIIDNVEGLNGTVSNITQEGKIIFNYARATNLNESTTLLTLTYRTKEVDEDKLFDIELICNEFKKIENYNVKDEIYKIENGEIKIINKN